MIMKEAWATCGIINNVWLYYKNCCIIKKVSMLVKHDVEDILKCTEIVKLFLNYHNISHNIAVFTVFINK